MTDLVAAVRSYADRFHRTMPPGHQIASPLGAWLLLALAGPASQGADREALTEMLGLDVDAAADAVGDLIAHPHPAVGAALALWQRPAIATDASRAWSGALPAGVEHGDVPSQADADRWAAERTFGLIERFPLAMTPQITLVLASALATRVSWQRPFTLAPAAGLGDCGWSGRLTDVLHSTDGRGHASSIARTGAGDVAVHTAAAAEGLNVTAVIASGGVPAPDVLDAAHQIATSGAAQRLSLFDLPLGSGHSWTITEGTEHAGTGTERFDTLIPAWTARSDHDLTRPGIGLDVAATAVGQLLGGGLDWGAKQAAVAGYTREGFEAAAVSAMFMATSARMQGERTVRTAQIRFAHPFAVVATCAGGGPWDGLPVFSAWVGEPCNAT